MFHPVVVSGFAPAARAGMTKVAPAGAVLTMSPKLGAPARVPPKKKGKADALPLIVRFYRCTGTRLQKACDSFCKAGVCSSQDLVRSASTCKALPAPKGLADCDGAVISLGSSSLEFLQD
jgi:hypothetical protein